MKGKAKEKRKIGKAILIGMGFFLTIILTFTSTVAWFYDSDWASKNISMAGSVGIEIRNEAGVVTSGAGNLYFHIEGEKAYPGQSVDVSASVFNNGGKSGLNGSACYVRAHFAVYTDIGKMPILTDYGTDVEGSGATSKAYLKAIERYKYAHNLADNAEVSEEDLEAAGIIASDYEIADGDTVPVAYTRDLAEAEAEVDMDAQTVYMFLKQLIDKQNALLTSEDENEKTDYYWVYYQHEGATPLSSTGTETSDVEYYIDGQKVKDGTHDSDNTEATEVANVTKVKDKGYFYLCTSSVGLLRPLTKQSEAVFLCNNSFIIPWQLTNTAADKRIFIGLSFQAIQTYIPVVGSNGVISGEADNQLDESLCTYNHPAVQTVFNSCNFTPIDTKLNIGGKIVDFADGSYDLVTGPSTVTPPEQPNSGQTAE